jgi:hypothetical protein
MPNENDKKDAGKSIADRLGIDEQSDANGLDDLTSLDGSEDPGAELDKEFANVTKTQDKDLEDKNGQGKTTPK